MHSLRYVLWLLSPIPNFDVPHFSSKLINLVVLNLFFDVCFGLCTVLFCHCTVTAFYLHAACIRKVVPPSTPREEMGSYWGYKVRYASSLSGVFKNSPYKVQFSHSQFVVQKNWVIVTHFYPPLIYSFNIFTISRKNMTISLALQSMDK